MTESEGLSKQLHRLADEAARLREEAARLGAALDFMTIASDGGTSALLRPLDGLTGRIDHLGAEAVRLGLTPTEAEPARRRLGGELAGLREELDRLRPRFDRASSAMYKAGRALAHVEVLLDRAEAGDWLGEPRVSDDIRGSPSEQPASIGSPQSGPPCEAHLISEVRLHGEPLRQYPPDPPTSGGKGPKPPE